MEAKLAPFVDLATLDINTYTRALGTAKMYQEGPVLKRDKDVLQLAGEITRETDNDTLHKII